MRRRSGAVDCVVFGHLHLPVHRAVGGVLMFSTGAVHVPELDPGYDSRGLRSGGFRRFRRRLPPHARGPSVGPLEVGPGGVRAPVIPLAGPIREERRAP